MVDDKPIATQAGSTANGITWNALGIFSRQIFLIISAILLARILGPSNYAVVALAGVYTAFTTLLLDQGLTAPLIAKQQLTERYAGASATLNIILAGLLAVASVLVAPAAAEFVDVPDFKYVMVALAVALPFKALSIVPRAILARSVNFRTQALVDVVASMIGGVVLIVFLTTGSSYWSFVYQVVAVDVAVAVGLLTIVRPPLLNVRLGQLSESFGFGMHVLLSNLLTYTVQNLDNVLVGRYLGANSLSIYAVAYRLVTTPVQLVGQIVSRVMFPVISRMHNEGAPITVLVDKTVRVTSILILPTMAIVAAGAPEIVSIVLGPEWSAAALTLSIFAIAGGRQAITTLNTPVLMGTNHSGWLLRFSAVAATVQISAILVGLQWGVNGVAICYTLAGFILTPVVMWLQKKTHGFSYLDQIKAILPGLHCALWVAAVYFLMRHLTEMGSLPTLMLGLVLALVVSALLVVAFHRNQYYQGLQLLRKAVRIGHRGSEKVQ